MVFKIVVDVTDCCSFPRRSSLIYEEIDLSWSFEVDWPRLHGITGYVNLLGVIKEIVYSDI